MWFSFTKPKASKDTIHSAEPDNENTCCKKENVGKISIQIAFKL